MWEVSPSQIPSPEAGACIGWAAPTQAFVPSTKMLQVLQRDSGPDSGSPYFTENTDVETKREHFLKTPSSVFKLEAQQVVKMLCVRKKGRQAQCEISAPLPSIPGREWGPLSEKRQSGTFSSSPGPTGPDLTVDPESWVKMHSGAIKNPSKPQKANQTKKTTEDFGQRKLIIRLMFSLPKQ